MNYFCRKLFTGVLPFFIIFAVPIKSEATTVIMLSDKELIVSSRVIITGQVRSVFSAWDDARETIWTYVEIIPDRVLKGQISSEKIVLKQLGGTVGLSGLHVFGQPYFLPNQNVLLYLNTSSDGTLRVAHSFMGMFSITEDSASGRMYVSRAIQSDEVQILARGDGEAVTDRAPLDSYLQKLEETLRSEAGEIARIETERAHLPIYEEPSEFSRKRASGYSPQFVLIGGGVRWMQGDVSFALNQNQSPVSGGGVSEIGRAMGAWATQGGASINLQVSGQASSCGLVSDGVNTISFADCLSQLDTPINCSGVVALTRVSWSNQSQVIGGRSFKTLLEADIIFNKGMNCFLGTPANLAEVACHEIGHAIGLDHSSDSSALMWPTAHGRSRDAVLGNDDITGIQTIYPSSGGGGGGGGGGQPPVTPVSIISNSAPDGVVGRTYKQTLLATGGRQPYRWSITGGLLPPGLGFSSAGVIEGVPMAVGSYFVTVQVVDSSSSVTVDTERVSIKIVNANSAPSVFPIVTRVKTKKSKKLWVYGNNFRPDSIIILNGFLLTPKEYTQDGATGRLFFKGRLPLGASGSNVLFVQNAENRSSAFVF
jgi:hypothetical protein